MKKALLIGINYIGTQYELSGCINDIINIGQYINTAYPDCIIKMFRDDINPNDTKHANIIWGLQWLLKNVNPGDTIYLHYSGHGSYIKDLNGDEDDKRDECIVSSDLKYITDDYLISNFICKVPRNVNLVCVFDSCFSGTVLDLPYKMTIDPKQLGSKQFKISNNIKNNPAVKNIKCNVVCFSGSTDAQTSADTSAPNTITKMDEAQGAMTWSVMTALTKVGIMKNTDFLLLVYNNLKNNNYDQDPVLSTNLLRNFAFPFKLL